MLDMAGSDNMYGHFISCFYLRVNLVFSVLVSKCDVFFFALARGYATLSHHWLKDEDVSTPHLTLILPAVISHTQNYKSIWHDDGSLLHTVKKNAA